MQNLNSVSTVENFMQCEIDRRKKEDKALESFREGFAESTYHFIYNYCSKKIKEDYTDLHASGLFSKISGRTSDIKSSIRYYERSIAQAENIKKRLTLDGKNLLSSVSCSLMKNF